MTGATIDHMISVTVFVGAMLLFISLFNQTIQTAILYQRHRYIATKCSDMLDGMLLNPGNPIEWGKTNSAPTGFGLQDPEFTQYRLSPYSLMRLVSSTGTPITYPKTGATYSNMSMGFGNFLFVPYTKAINYSIATKLLGINNKYGFQLTITPIVTVSVKETHSANPLTLTVNVTGTGFPLANATVSYCFLKVVPKGQGQYPSYTSSFGTAFADVEGEAVLSFPGVTSTDSYALIAYAHLSGLVGIGYHERVSPGARTRYVIPFIDSFADRRVIMAHSYDVHYFEPPESAVFYNATFVLLTEDFTLREMPMENSTGKADKVNYGEGQPYKTVTIPTYNPGILIITYMSNNEYGVVLMPWGMSSMAFPVTFGDSPLGKEWVATDTRMVLVNGIAYRAMLSLWSLAGYSVVS
jgi:hypothetical protein